jgi:hypothetical protein
MSNEKLNPLKTIKELMEKHKSDNPLFTLRCCVHECGTNANNYSSNYTPEKEHLVLFWVELYNFFAELTSGFGTIADDFRFWIDYDGDIKYSYLKDYDYGYNLQIKSESCSLVYRIKSDSHTLEEAIEMFKNDEKYKNKK